MSCDDETDAETAQFTGRRGDTWRQSWTAGADELADWDESTLLVQIRDGDDEDATLVASTDGETDVAVIDISATDFAADLFEWQVEPADTSDIEAEGDYWIEAECEIDGRLTTFLRHRWWVDPQVAVAGSGS